MNDIDFLQDLQNELKTQPHLSTASPRYWVVMVDKAVPAIEGQEEYFIIYDVGSVCDYDIDEFVEHQKERMEEEGFNVDWGNIINEIESNPNNKIELEYQLELLKEFDSEQYEVYGEKVEEVFEPNTFFLTMRDCKEHIRLNHYHYRNPRAYCMHAWRSPEFERFLKIFLDMDLDKYQTEG